MTNPATHLRAAAAYLDEHGWVQDRYKTEDGKVCVGRALDQTGTTAGAWCAFYKFTGTGGITAWNDHDGRTLDEVKAALLGAADAFERENPEWPR